MAVHAHLFVLAMSR